MGLEDRSVVRTREAVFGERERAWLFAVVSGSGKVMREREEAWVVVKRLN